LVRTSPFELITTPDPSDDACPLSTSTVTTLGCTRLTIEARLASSATAVVAVVPAVAGVTTAEAVPLSIR
jgi:hypothetical protein